MTQDWPGLNEQLNGQIQKRLKAEMTQWTLACWNFVLFFCVTAALGLADDFMGNWFCGECARMGRLALDSSWYLLTRCCNRKWKQMLVGGGFVKKLVCCLLCGCLGNKVLGAAGWAVSGSVCCAEVWFNAKVWIWVSGGYKSGSNKNGNSFGFRNQSGLEVLSGCFSFLLFLFLFFSKCSADHIPLPKCSRIAP